DDHTMAGDAYERVALHRAVGDVAARHAADLGDLEDSTDVRVAEDLLADLGGEHALGGLLEVVGDVVDDLVGADLNALLLGKLAGLAGGDDIETDDDGLGRVGQEHVALGDAAHRRVDDAGLDLL